MTHPADDSLKPCPFCGAGTTEITPNGRMWTGTKYSEPSSVSVRHWCEAVPGQPSRMIERVGRDEASAIAAWNGRALLAEQARTEHYRHAGYFREGASAMSHRLWEQGGHDQADGEVELFERLAAHKAEDAPSDAELLDWAEKNNVAWCLNAWADGADSHIYHGPFNDRKTVFAPTLRQAIRKAMMRKEQSK